SASGLYLYNRANAPASTIMPSDSFFMADPPNGIVWFGPLRRRPHVLVVNATDVLNDRTVLTMRYGFSTWQDSCDKQTFTPGIQSLGFSPTYVNALPAEGRDTFPSLIFDQVEKVGGGGGAPIRWESPASINAAGTHLPGSRSFQI